MPPGDICDIWANCSALRIIITGCVVVESGCKLTLGYSSNLFHSQFCTSIFSLNADRLPKKYANRFSPESPLERQMRALKGPTLPYAMNRKKYRIHPRMCEDELGSIAGPLEDKGLPKARRAHDNVVYEKS